MISMNAVRIDAFGGPEQLRLEQIPVTEPRGNELLVKVMAAGVNPVDQKIRAGEYPAVRSNMLPYVLGRDIAGVVGRIGPAVRFFKEGDAIYAMPGIDRGSYAQHVIVKETEAALKPKSLDHVAAAAVPLASLTAWQGLFQHGGLKAGQRVLIHGGSGGVGHFAIQFAKATGAYVITTVSHQHLAFVRRLGADKAIDYKAQRFEDVVHDIDLVFDLIAGETQDRSWGVLKKGGSLVSTLAAPSQEKAAAHGVRAMRYTAQESGAELAEIAALIDSGAVKPVVSKTFPLREARAAQQFIEEGHPEGKVVLTVD
jgi:NADPH:quinone reductase-like Zn-dependent oxidoreductase